MITWFTAIQYIPNVAIKALAKWLVVLYVAERVFSSTPPYTGVHTNSELASFVFWAVSISLTFISIWQTMLYKSVLSYFSIYMSTFFFVKMFNIW